MIYGFGSPIVVISSEGDKYFFEYKTHASKQLGLDRSSINKCLDGTQKTTKGYKIMSLSDYLKQ